MGDVQDGWLPRLANGTSLGTRPVPLADRYDDLYNTFGGAWRVTTLSSLFDYASGTSTKTFTYPGWPPMTARCVVPKQPSVPKLLDAKLAETACARIRDDRRKVACVFDVRVTNDTEVARTFENTERLLAGATITSVAADKAPTRLGEGATFTAVVERKVPARGLGAPAGTVQFLVDDVEVARVPLNARGQASWTTTFSEAGRYHVTATYVPVERSELFGSSGEVSQTVGDTAEPASD